MAKLLKLPKVKTLKINEDTHADLAKLTGEIMMQKKDLITFDYTIKEIINERKNYQQTVIALNNQIKQLQVENAQLQNIVQNMMNSVADVLNNADKRRLLFLLTEILDAARKN